MRSVFASVTRRDVPNSSSRGVDAPDSPDHAPRGDDACSPPTSPVHAHRMTSDARLSGRLHRSDELGEPFRGACVSISSVVLRRAAS